MSKWFFQILSYIAIGNIALVILASFGLSAWPARLIACLLVGLCAALGHYFEKYKSKI